MNELAIAFLGLITTIGGSVGTWLISRRKGKEEVKTIELQNAERVINMWRGLYEELHKKVQGLEKEIQELREELASIEKTNQKKCDSCKYKKAYENR